jgi:hypothetical protein
MGRGTGEGFCGAGRHCACERVVARTSCVVGTWAGRRLIGLGLVKRTPDRDAVIRPRAVEGWEVGKPSFGECVVERFEGGGAEGSGRVTEQGHTPITIYKLLRLLHTGPKPYSTASNNPATTSGGSPYRSLAHLQLTMSFDTSSMQN